METHEHTQTGQAHTVRAQTHTHRDLYEIKMVDSEYMTGRWGDYVSNLRRRGRVKEGAHSQ